MNPVTSCVVAVGLVFAIYLIGKGLPYLIWGPMWPCFVLPWHRLYVVEEFDQDCRKLRCSCGRAYHMNDRVKLVVPWDDEFEELYDEHKSRQTGNARSDGGD
jgi:hypothetical protein